METPSSTIGSSTPQYLGFISYRHVEPDRNVAAWLHRAIETYRVPREIQRRYTVAGRTGRIFRDEEELPSSADLSASIRSALQQSRVLIVVASPRFAESRWCREEVLAFRRMGRPIIAVLIEGDPNSAGQPSDPFIPELRRAPTSGADPSSQPLGEWALVEPLAADLRPASGHSERSRRRTVKLKVIAALLNVPFADLDARERRRARKRSLVAALCVVALLLGIAYGASRVRAERMMRSEIAAFSAAQRVGLTATELGHEDTGTALRLFALAHDMNEALPPRVVANGDALAEVVAAMSATVDLLPLSWRLPLPPDTVPVSVDISPDGLLGAAVVSSESVLDPATDFEPSSMRLLTWDLTTLDATFVSRPLPFEPWQVMFACGPSRTVVVDTTGELWRVELGDRGGVPSRISPKHKLRPSSPFGQSSVIAVACEANRVVWLSGEDIYIANLDKVSEAAPLPMHQLDGWGNLSVLSVSIDTTASSLRVETDRGTFVCLLRGNDIQSWTFDESKVQSQDAGSKSFHGVPKVTKARELLRTRTSDRSGRMIIVTPIETRVWQIPPGTEPLVALSLASGATSASGYIDRPSAHSLAASQDGSLWVAAGHDAHPFKRSMTLARVGKYSAVVNRVEWDTEGTPIKDLTKLRSSHRCVVISGPTGSGRQLIAAASEAGVYVFNPADTDRRVLVPMGDVPVSLRFAQPQGEEFRLFVLDVVGRVWRVEIGTTVRVSSTSDPNSYRGSALSVSPDARRVFVIDDLARLHQLDGETLLPASEPLEIPGLRPTGLELDESGSRMLAFGRGGLALIDLAGRRVLRKIDRTGMSVVGAFFAPPGHYVIWGENPERRMDAFREQFSEPPAGSSSVRILDLRDGRTVTGPVEVLALPEPIAAMSPAPDAGVFGVLSVDFDLRVLSAGPVAGADRARRLAPGSISRELSERYIPGLTPHSIGGGR